MEADGLIVGRPARGGYMIYKRDEKTQAQFDPIPNYNYDNKSQWRSQWFEFISKHILFDKNTKVLFMPGPQALEFEGYKALGVNPENMIGVEKHPYRAKLIRDLGLGIRVENMDLVDYLSQTNEQFDVVLLDYDGHIQPDVVVALEQLVSRGVLKDESCFGINVYGRREKDDDKLLYLEPFIEKGFKSFNAAKLVSKDDVPDEVLDWQNNFNGMRNFGLTALALRLFMAGNATGINEQMLKKLPKVNRDEITEKIAANPPTTYMQKLELNEQIRYTLMQTLRKGCPPLGADKADRSALRKLAMLYDVFTSQPYFVEGMQRLLYAANDGNNVFLSDFYALDKKQEVLSPVQKGKLKSFMGGSRKAENFVKSYDNLSSVEQGDIGKLVGRVLNDLKVAYSTLFLAKDSVPRRQWVGIPTKKALDKAQKGHVAYLLSLGRSDDEILEVHPEAADSLAGIKSAKTKGHYDEYIAQFSGGKK